MAIECVKDVTLPQVPDLDGGIVGRREEVPTVGVEGYLVD